MLISDEPQSVAFAPDPTSWAIEDLIQVPGFRDLEKLVNLIESSAAHVGSDITVERREAVVVLTISQKIPASEEGSLNRMTVDFDLSLGGMITLVDWRIQHPKHDADQLLTMQWKRVGTAVIPERRMVHVKATVGGIVKQDDQTLIEFKKFDLAPQDLSTFTVDSLGLADGTNIRDSTNGLRFVTLKVRWTSRQRNNKLARTCQPEWLLEGNPMNRSGGTLSWIVSIVAFLGGLVIYLSYRFYPADGNSRISLLIDPPVIDIGNLKPGEVATHQSQVPIRGRSSTSWR